MWLPSRKDAFWLLLLHCLLDRHAVPVHYRSRLSGAPAGVEGGVARAMARRMPAAELDRLRAAAAAERWDELLAAASRVRAAVERSVPLRRRVALIAARGARWARRPALLRRRRGVGVALLGSNGVGKSTLAASLRARLPLPSDLIYMGLWSLEEPGGVGAIGAALRRPLRAWARYARALWLRLQGHVVVYDRYVYDALLPPRPPLVALKRVYLRALTRAVPAPDLLVVLDVPPEVAHARKQENTPEELAGERAVYRRLAAQLPGAALVDASRGSDEVRAEVTELLWHRLARRWRGEVLA
jgi:thymidylate kinase